MRLVRWVLVVTLGEAVGISVPAAVGVAVTGASWGPLATLVAIGGLMVLTSLPLAQVFRAS